MCKCTPNLRTPFCGKGDCVWPHERKEKTMEQKPSIGRIVWYQRHGSPDGTHKAEPSPAIITKVADDEKTCNLFVMNPNGCYFNLTPFAETLTPGCWSWPVY